MILISKYFENDFEIIPN